MASENFVIRDIDESELDQLSQLSQQTFLETFVEDFKCPYTEEDLKHFFSTRHTVEEYKGYLDNPAYRIWVATLKGEFIGYAMTGPVSVPHVESTDACQELWRIYIKRSHQGVGAGGLLFRTALDHMESKNPPKIWIGVWSENFRAQDIYKKQGFSKVGEYKYPVGNTFDHEFIFNKTYR